MSKNPESLHKNQGVYFIKDVHGKIKIGLAQSLSQRILQYKSFHSQPLTVLAVFFRKDYDKLHDLEAFYQNRFFVFRVHGEWFDIPEKFYESITSEMTEDEELCCKMLSKMLVAEEGIPRRIVAASFLSEYKTVTFEELATKLNGG